MSAPLTVGTAGHVDHGKTALARALTGRDTDRLAEERRRGISIELGYAPLALPSGRRLSLIDVPGHERFVRTMVAGATGVDLFLLCIAADDGVMPQTREHLAVLRGLGVTRGVVAVTKADLADPAGVLAAAQDLGLPAVVVVAPEGRGVDELRAALDAVAAGVPSRAGEGEPVLHVDRAFTIRGAGTIVTGTLWSGAIGRGDALQILRGERAPLRARVRSVHVHDEGVERAQAGQRVAVNLVGVEVGDVGRGDVLATGDLDRSWILDCELDERIEHGSAWTVHHGTRETPARVGWLGGRFHQLRCSEPLAARRDDRLVLRSSDGREETLVVGGRVLDPRARKHGPSNDALVRLARLARGEPEPANPASSGGSTAIIAVDPPLDGPEVDEALARALDARLRAAGHEPPLDADLPEEERAALGFLRDAGRIVRLGPSMHVHASALAAVEERVRDICTAEGTITIARLRDELQTTRRYAQALLERLDAERVTLRVGDERRLRRR